VTHFLGISRELECSPGRHADNDARILAAALGELARDGYTVALTAPEDVAAPPDAAVIVSMSRSPRVLALLADWERAGTVVVNKPGAVLASARSRLAARTLSSVDRPRGQQVVPTARDVRSRVTPPPAGWWIKGGDLNASRREDVRRIDSMDALHDALDDFAQRGITTAVLQAHVTGREIKFYAVGDGFFHAIDTATQQSVEDADASFRRRAIAAGRALGLEIFGGDLMIEDGGRVTLIDLNDWPSFAPCPDAGARAMARYLQTRLAAASGALSVAAAVAGPSVS